MSKLDVGPAGSIGAEQLAELFFPGHRVDAESRVERDRRRDVLRRILGNIEQDPAGMASPDGCSHCQRERLEPLVVAARPLRHQPAVFENVLIVASRLGPPHDPPHLARQILPRVFEVREDHSLVEDQEV